MPPGYRRTAPIKRPKLDGFTEIIDLDDLADDDCQDIALTLNTASRKCLGYRTPIEAFLAELGKDVTIRFA